MGNMSYCRFENTAGDLQDCYDNWDETPDKELSDFEKRGKERILKLCKYIVGDYSGDE